MRTVPLCFLNSRKLLTKDPCYARNTYFDENVLLPKPLPRRDLRILTDYTNPTNAIVF